jgi:hypothetical protein
MDDCSVGRVQWVDGSSVESPASLSDTPERIASASAYLLLYRRRDFDPRPIVSMQRDSLQGNLKEFLEAHNGDFHSEQEKYMAQEALLQKFAMRRAGEIHELVSALEKVPRGNQPSDYSVVPRTWLNDFLHGEDYQEAGENSFLQKPPCYQPVLLCSRSESNSDPQGFLNPLAVWRGEVAFLPKQALDHIGLGSLFSSASDLISRAAADELRQAWKAWHKEFTALRHLEQSRIVGPEFRMDAQAGPAVWLSKKAWTKLSKMIDQVKFCEAIAWKLFLEEALAVQRRSCSGGKPNDKENADVGNSTTSPQGKDTDQADAQKDAGDAAETPGIPLKVHDVLNYDGIICDHGLVGKPKAVCLCPQEMVENLLELGEEKANAYRSLLGSCRGTISKTDHQDKTLFASSDVRSLCCRELANQFDTSRDFAPSACTITMDPGQGQRRKNFILHLAMEEGQTLTGHWLREMASAQVGQALGDMHARSANGSTRIVHDNDVLEKLPFELQVQLKSEQNIAETEGSAFRRSVLRVRRNS